MKRNLGDHLGIGADVLKDGHDLLRARIRYRPPQQRRWYFSPLEYHYNPDRWFGDIILDRLGRWQFSVEAWPDHWGTWTTDLKKRIEAGQDVEPELLEGAALLFRAAHHVQGPARVQLKDAAQRLGKSARPLKERIQLALCESLEKLMQEPLAPEDLTRSDGVFEVIVDRPRAVFGAWYEMFPRSQAPKPGVPGTFSDAARRLPELAELGFDVVYLPPIHPIGHTHRKGRNNARVAEADAPGSPWAIGSQEGGHTAVHPELGNLDDFAEFVATAQRLGMEVALDYALQCSPDHPWAREHPEWFFIRPDGSIRYAENPPKKYEDIYPLNFWCVDHMQLWNACRDVLLFWIERGVRIFRVDNPHTKPLAFWKWVIAEIQCEHPDVIFLSEAFTRPKRMQALAMLGFNQSYTYFTWKNSPWEIKEYLTELTQTEMVEYFRPNFFTNTPDILHAYLQEGGRAAFRVRLLLAATLSPSYGVYSGFELCENTPLHEGSEEYLNSEKYEIRWRDWNAPGNLKAEIQRLNRLRREQPALQRLANLSFHPSENEQVLWYQKSAPEGDLFIAVNLDPRHSQETIVVVPLLALALSVDQPYEVEDLLTGERYTWRGARNYVRLDPAERVGHVFRFIPAQTGRPS